MSPVTVWKERYLGLVKLLKDLEWAGLRERGEDAMGGPSPGTWPSCPACGGAKPLPLVECEYLPEAIGHTKICPLAKAIR